MASEAAENFLLAHGSGSEQRRNAVALDQLGELRLEARTVGHVLVDLHPGGLVVPAPQQPPADSGRRRQLPLQRADRQLGTRGLVRRYAVVDVITEAHATA